MRNRRTFLSTACAGLWLLASCAHTGTDSQSPGNLRRNDAATFHLVRHAEKGTTPAEDPALTDVGRQRAQRLASLLQDAPPTAIYSTDYDRTRATATAAAQRFGRDISIYDARRPAVEFAEELRRRHTAGVVLVVGHSNTVAPIASALCRCDVAPLREDEYDRWITIEIDGDGGASLRTTRY
ncbi:MAG: histidine phosphatase family protein [Xanthomonadaceae bacterium]|nr:histidine phosphatase family protein [Xanthomonadaceae bacterium]